MARSLGALPRLAQALARGELSYSKVRALTRIATPEIEERLLKVGLAGTAEHVERIVRGWRRVDRKVEVEETARWHKHRALHVYHDDDGMVIVRARLEPQAGAVLIQAIAAAREALRQRVRAPTSVMRPSASWRITTRLASHASRWDVSAGTYAPSSTTDCPGASASASTAASTWTTTW